MIWRCSSRCSVPRSPFPVQGSQFRVPSSGLRARRWKVWLRRGKVSKGNIVNRLLTKSFSAARCYLGGGLPHACSQGCLETGKKQPNWTRVPGSTTQGWLFGGSLFKVREIPIRSRYRDCRSNRKDFKSQRVKVSGSRDVSSDSGFQSSGFRSPASDLRSPTSDIKEPL